MKIHGSDKKNGDLDADTDLANLYCSEEDMERE